MAKKVGSKVGRQQQKQSTLSQARQATSAVELLKEDHRKVEQLFEELKETDDGDKQQELAQQICKKLMIHDLIEEEIFYQECRDAFGDEEEGRDQLDQAQVEHDSAKLLINEIIHGDADEPYWKAKVLVLCDQIHHHIEEEEKPADGVMAQAQEHGVDTADLAGRLKHRKADLEQHAAGLRPIRAVSLNQPSHMGGRLSRYGGPQRDERGRYMSDHDERYYRSRLRYGEDDDRGRGWHGDPRGHSEASRRGWGERRGLRYDDDDRGYSRSRHYYEDEDDRRGWYGDQRGHSEASRRGWQHRR